MSSQSPHDPDDADAPATVRMHDGRPPAGSATKEPSLGPACLVVVVLGLATFSAICAFGSYFMLRDQYPLAEKAIRQQLIPWIESSQLAEEDRAAIIAELEHLLPLLRNRQIDPQQLSRLHSCLQDNPVLLWGAVQAVERQAAAAGLSDVEITALRRLNQRLLRGAAERILSRNDIEYVLQPCARVRDDGQSLEAREGLSADELRQYMQRAEQVLERNRIPNEPYPRTPAEAFATLIDEALHGSPQP
ncbi:MAG: hypothetical protein KatS3mg111_2160 [Pirellulaceae bacterium]|nr:MAG: hypothetical protein KatS3mg111_2160 [Pirellulaceae bacterium]